MGGWAATLLGRRATYFVISLASLVVAEVLYGWLNPLLASPRYEPLARGMRAARPYVDDFLAANNIASLGQLASRLEGLPAERPAEPTTGFARLRDYLGWLVAEHQPVRGIVLPCVFDIDRARDIVAAELAVFGRELGDTRA